MEKSMLNATYWEREKTSAYKIPNRHCVLTPGNPKQGNDLEEDWRDGGETNYICLLEGYHLAEDSAR